MFVSSGGTICVRYVQLRPLNGLDCGSLWGEHRPDS